MSAIDVTGVSKRYRRTVAGGPRTLRDLGLNKRVEHWALRDVSFSIRSGESVGLIGRNGSGKSTLLRVIAGTTTPTAGKVRTGGVVGGLLSLGSGLDESLSAEENAFTGAVLAGVRRSDVAALLPRIAEFAELEDVFHEPMRTFSDGMKLRLAFATAVHVSPQILLIDEVLAVGDAVFRAKCIQRLHEMRDTGMTFVVVSHAMAQIEELCDRAIWLDHGTVRYAGPTASVLERYEEANAADAQEHPSSGHGRRFGDATVLRVEHLDLLRPSNDAPIRMTRAGQPASVVLRLARGTAAPGSEVRISVSVHRASDYSRLIDLSTVIRLGAGELTEARLDLDRLDLSSGEYWLNSGAFSADWGTCFDYVWESVGFTVDGPSEAGPLVPPLTWTVGAPTSTNGTTASTGASTGDAGAPRPTDALR